MKPNAERLNLALYPRQYAQQTRYGDMDAQNHLNNVAIAGLYEDARVRMNGEIMGQFGERPPGMRIMAANVSIAYLHEGFYPGEIIVGCGVAAIGRTSHTIGQALFQNGRCIGAADTILVFSQDNRPAPMPEGMLKALAKFALAASSGARTPAN